MKKICIFPLVMAGLLASACLQEDRLPEGAPENQYADKMTVRFTIRQEAPAAVTKSILPNVDEHAVHDLLLMAYSRGKLIDWRKIQDPMEHPEELQLSLQKNSVHHLYAVANGFGTLPPADEAEMKEKMCCSFRSVKELEKGLPMAWAEEFGALSGQPVSPVGISLRRLAGKVILTMDTAAMKGYCCDKVRLRQVPNAVYPFRNPEGCKAQSAVEVMDGDEAGPEDGALLLQGKPLVFYTLENCQGKLISGNTDPWKKVPDEMSGAQNTCTYIEVEGHFEEPSIHRGPVTLRFYLGRNACDDFNVDGNAIHQLNIIGSDRNLGKPSWKLEADTHLDPNKCKAWISEDSMHRDGLLYIGEYFKTEFTLDPELEQYLTERVGSLRMCFFPDQDADAGGSTPGIAFMEVWKGQPYHALGRCTAETHGSIWLCDRYGNKIIPLLNGIRVVEPLMKSNLTADSCCNVNEDFKISITFTDQDGRNLEKNPLGFDSSCFNVDLDGSTLPSDYFHIQSSGRRWTWNLRCDNDGTGHERNLQLARWISDGKTFRLTAREKKRNSALDLEMKLSHARITLDYECWRDEYKLSITNSSCLPLDIISDFCTQSTILRYEDKPRRDAIVPHYESTAEQQHWHFLFKYYEETDDPVFGCCHTIHAGKEADCTPHVENMGKWTYTIQNHAGVNIIESALYNFRDPSYTKLLTDVSLMGYPIEKGKVKVNSANRWNDWRYRGYTLYSADVHHVSAQTYILGEFKPHRMEEIKKAGKVYGLDFTWDSASRQLIAKFDRPDPGITLDVKTKGMVIGTATVQENNRPVQKRHSEFFEHESVELAITETGLAIDGDQIEAALRRVQEKTFTEHRPEGDVLVHARPEKIDFEIWIRLSSTSPEDIYATSISKEGLQFDYFNEAEQKTYVIEDFTRIHMKEFYDVITKN